MTSDVPANAEIDADVASLEQLVYDNPDLERLEAILDDFNPFEAMRWTRQEVRHSAFLRWLLDPAETHGLGPYFLRAFAKRVAHRSEGLSELTPSVFDVDAWEFDRTEVLQEWENVDLLVRDDSDGFVLLVENKIDSAEHSGQLQRYWALVNTHFPRHKRLLAYLTVGGAEPSDPSYVTVDYSEIVALIDETIARRGEQLSPEVRGFLTQYVEMVRRSIVEDSEIQQLCQRIYDKHRRAMDVLFEHRPDKSFEVTTMLRELIRGNPDLIEDHCSKSYVRFIPKALDILPREGEGWVESKRMVLFEIENYQSKLTLRVILGPGPQRLRELIQKAIAKRHEELNRARYRAYPVFWSFHGEPWVGKKRYDELSVEDLRGIVEDKLSHVVAEKVPAILGALEDVLGTL